MFLFFCFFFFKCENTVIGFILQCIAWGLVTVFETARATETEMRDYIEWKEIKLLHFCLCLRFWQLDSLEESCVEMAENRVKGDS